MITIYELLRFMAMGGKPSYLHRKKENKNTAALQNLLDNYKTEKVEK